MKKLTLLFLLCLALCLTILCACGDADIEESATSDDTIETQAPSDDSAWKEAYLDVLQQDQQAISDYSRSDVSGNVALNDLNGDGIPELIYFARKQESPFPYMEIWTYVDGAAQQIPYETTLADEEYSDLPTDALYDYEVQGGTIYMVFKTTDGSLQMAAMTYGAANSIGMIGTYQMDSSTTLNQTEWLGFVDEFMSSSTNPVSDEPIRYYRTGHEKISESDYNAARDAIAGSIDEVIFCTRGPVDAVEFNDLWSAAENYTPTGQTYDQIVQQLNQ